MHGYGMEGWNGSWMWMFGVVLVVIVVVLITRGNR